MLSRSVGLHCPGTAVKGGRLLMALNFGQPGFVSQGPSLDNACFRKYTALGVTAEGGGDSTWSATGVSQARVWSVQGDVDVRT
jgi:hypothetical protein